MALKFFTYLLLALLLNMPRLLQASEINLDNWLEWQSRENTTLPFSSNSTRFPPVYLYAQGDLLKGAIATPYAFSGVNNNIINDFLVEVIDSKGQSHFLSAQPQTAGFVDDAGIGLAMLESKGFVDGKVNIRLYRRNTPENQQILAERQNKLAQREKKIAEEIKKLALPKPIVNKTWPLDAKTLSGQHVDDLVKTTPWTIFQVYSDGCGFCSKAIPAINALHQQEKFTVIGIAGAADIDSFKTHIEQSEIAYPFVVYQGEVADSALTRALANLGTPTYLIVNNQKKLLGVYAGKDEFEAWLKTVR